jgi:hypothetical protein
MTANWAEISKIVTKVKYMKMWHITNERRVQPKDFR